jgi:hypothetical protein
METNKKQWPLPSIHGLRDKIETQTDYQRTLVWSLSQKRLLIDTILRGYDIPKLYWRKIGKDRYEVIDGQQRLNAIWSFMSNEFDTGNIGNIDGADMNNTKYKDLPSELRTSFDIYSLDIVIIDTDEEEVREMFLRLQNGTSLNAPERRHAMSGNMRNFVTKIAKHSFFKSCKKKDARYMFEQIAAQMTKLEINGGPCNIKSVDLNKMYEEYKKTKFDKKAKKIESTLNLLYKCFPKQTPELEWYAVITLYMVASTLFDKYVISGKETEIKKWFIKFETYRRDETDKGEDDCDREILNYNELTGHSTDSQANLKSRYDIFFKNLLEYMPKLELKDNNRMFSDEQRLAIYRKNDGKCQVKKKRKGEKCDWNNWQADHIKPWSKGGKTTVENGQVSCPACNAAKGAKV